jgi:rhamnosyltransferase
MISEVKNDNFKVSAILVTYNPDMEIFRAAVQAIFPQVADVIVVDNASANFSTDWSDNLIGKAHDKLQVLPQQENLGIAVAQNIGIEQAIKSDADFVFLLDQDSVSTPSLVSELLAVITSIEFKSSAYPIAAVGPTIVDRRTGKSYYFMADRNGFPHKSLPEINSKQSLQPIDVSVLVASGSLISIKALKDIGAMRSNYFINHVDTEWCLRAKAKGYRLLGVPVAKLEHQFGDIIKQVWFLGFRQVIYHSPLRNYYDIRNTLLMLHDTVMPWPWRLHFIGRILRLGYFMLFAEQRWLRLTLISLGLVHGMLRVSGCLEAKTGRCRHLPVSYVK